MQQIISDMTDRISDRLIEPHRRHRDKYIRRKQRQIRARRSVMKFVISFTMKFWTDSYLETVMSTSKYIGYL